MEKKSSNLQPWISKCNREGTHTMRCKRLKLRLHFQIQRLVEATDGLLADSSKRCMAPIDTRRDPWLNDVGHAQCLQGTDSGNPN